MISGGHHGEVEHHAFRIRFTELNEIYIFNTMRSLAFTFIVIFIPIYLFKLGYSAQIVFSYYASFYLLEALVEFITARLIRIFGPKHVIAAAVPFMIIHFWMLQTMADYSWHLGWVALSGAIGVGLFWQAYHYDFSKAKRKSKAASDVSRMHILLYSTAILAPFIGGFISDNYGERVVFGIVLALLILATTFLFKTGDKHSRPRKLDFSRLEWHCVRRDLLAYSGRGWEVAASMVIWPLFIYMIVGNYQSLGLVTSVSLLVATVITFLVGKKSDKNVAQKRDYIKYGSGLIGAVYFLKTLITNTVGVYVANISKSVIGAFVHAPWDSEYYLHADEQSRSEYILAMEVAVDVARALAFIIFILLSFFVSLEVILYVGLVIGGIGTILTGSMPLARCEACRLPKNKNIKLMPRPERR